ncbi:hypothetical protein ABPG77_005932 [Micractinium sp. CCAP 211/92]
MGAQKEEKPPPQQGGSPAQQPAPAQQLRRAAVGWGEGTQELLHISAVRPSTEKVDRVELHPVQPWLAYVDRNSNVSVWNYESDELLYDTQLGGADEAALQEAALRQRADRGAAAAGLSGAAAAAQEASLAAKGTASGLVRDIKFLDMDTCFWQIARQHWMQYGAFDDHTIPYLGRYKGLQGKRWLVIACENKVVLHDLASADARDIPRSSCFESRAPTALAFLLLNLPSLTGYTASGGAAQAKPELLPVMAVGTAAGSIFLISPDTMTVYAKLSGAHGKAVTAMLPLASEAPGGPDMLLTASADGTLAVWDPSRTPVRGADRELAPRHSFKAHDNGITAMTYFLAYTEKPEPPVLRLATTGDDKRVHMWEVGSWKPFAKAQPLQKATCHSIGWAPWGGTGLGLHPSLLLATGEAPLILGLDPATGGMERYCGLEGKVDPGQKKVPKIYHLAVHPTRPHLVAAATNTGAVLLSFDSNERPPVVALPAQVVTLEALLQQSNTPEKDKRASDPGAAGGKGAQGLTYVMASGGRLWSTALRLESQRAEGAAERTISLSSGAREAIAALDHPGRPVLACSASGRSISAVWPQLRAYTVYSLAPTGSWEVVDRGSGNNVVWSSTQPMYAVISVPNIPTATIKKKRGFFGGKKAAAAAQEAEEAAQAAAQAAAATTVEVHVVNEEAGSQFIATHEVGLGGEQPVVLHGGGLLGVVLNKPAPSGTGRALQFVSWKGFAPVGPQLPEPVWVSWEPECTLLALAYEHTIELCRTRPAFERFASISIAESVAGIWQSRQLYISTPTSVHVAFADPVTALVQEVQLASFQGGVDSKTSPAAEATPLPPEQMRPPGPLTLAGVRHSYLWLADCLGRPFLVSLRHPGLRLRCLAARGEISTARTIAERGLAAGFHDEAARFLAAMSPQEGVREALALPGLTPPAEMALSIRSDNWDRAARCFQALALGVSDKGLLQLFADGGGAAGSSPVDVAARLAGLSLESPAAQNAAAVEAMLEAHARNPEASFAEGLDSPPAAAANGGADDSSDDDEAPAAEAVKPAVDPVDWEAPLVAGGAPPGAAGLPAAAAAWDGEEGEGGAAGMAGSSCGAPGTGFVGPAERQRLVAVAELGLRFAEAATNAGHEDAARSALGVLVRSAHLLPPALAERLVFSMGQCSMTESARNLASAVAASKAPGSLSDPAVSSLLAALVGGMHGPAVQGTLQAAGLAPLAAVYSAVWGTGDRQAALADWRRQLAAAHPEAAVAVVPPPA